MRDAWYPIPGMIDVVFLNAAYAAVPSLRDGVTQEQTACKERA
jgi:hypothetical protein